MSVTVNVIVYDFPSLLISADWCTYFKSGLIKSTKSPFNIVASLVFPPDVIFPVVSVPDVISLSFITFVATSIVTVPLQSLYSLIFLDFSKSDNTNSYCCDTVCAEPFTVAVVSFAVTLVNDFVILLASSPSTNTLILSAVNNFVVSKYLSITLNLIVSVFAVASLVDDTFSTLGFIKST